MKLKKIASLALAGIMAVSMLAGCKDGGNGNNGSSSSEPTNPATGISTIFYNELSKAAQNSLEMSDSSDLNNALTKIIEDLDTNDIRGAYSTDATYSNTLSTAIAAPALLDCEVGIASAEDADDVKDETTYTSVYTVGYDINDKGALKDVVDAIDDVLSQLPTTGEADDDTYEYDWTGSVSVANRTFINDNGVERSVKYVAVSLTQTPTKTANG